MSDLIVVTKSIDGQDTLVVDSRLVAIDLGVGHADWCKNIIVKHQKEIEVDFGIVRFENGLSGKAGRPQVFAWLTEDQVLTYTTYSKNTEQVRAVKRRLVKNFSLAKKLLQQQQVTSCDCSTATQTHPQSELERQWEVARCMGLDEDPCVRTAFVSHLIGQLETIAQTNQPGGTTVQAAKNKPARKELVTAIQRCDELGFTNQRTGQRSEVARLVKYSGLKPIGRVKYLGIEATTYLRSPELDAVIVAHFKWRGFV